MEEKKKLELITIKQLPIITEQMEILSVEIKKDVEEALALECTEDNIQEVKKARAKLNTQSKEFETQRVAIKNKILEPYVAIENIYNEKIKIQYTDADTKLKAKIDTIESEVKKQKWK
jgi:seryl-tRNA synthetase